MENIEILVLHEVLQIIFVRRQKQVSQKQETTYFILSNNEHNLFFKKVMS